MALDKIDHIVVVMMENRSFDHMLGYLALEGGIAGVEGLAGPDANFNPGPNGERIPITAFDADSDRVQRHGEALQKNLDPDHSTDGVKHQLGNPRDRVYPMDGFVKQFVASRPSPITQDLWMVPMGYYTADDLPTYDFLARNFCVCDHWHSSIPGNTWPNRLYALAGTTSELAHEDFFKHVVDFLQELPFKQLGNAPIFDVEAFTRQLRDDQWRWYSHDPATLRAADSLYRRVYDLKPDNFAYFDRKKVSLATQVVESAVVGHDSFLDDAAKGQLRDVSWIDPNFVDLSIFDPNSNDDHPPTDIRAGQAFVLDVYEALRRSPNWDATLLVVVYDEHGGFYDHVSPPPADDGSGFESFGVRVPAIAIGPRVKREVCHERFDHTTLIKTILTRFAPDGIEHMPQRVRDAPGLDVVLQDDARDDIDDAAAQRARDAIDAWRTSARAARTASDGGPSQAPDGAGQPLVVHEFQQEFAQFALAMRHLLPPGQP